MALPASDKRFVSEMVSARLMEVITEETEYSNFSDVPRRSVAIFTSPEINDSFSFCSYSSSFSEVDYVDVSSEAQTFDGITEKSRFTRGEILAVILLMIINFPMELVVFLVESVLGLLPSDLQNHFRVSVSRVIVLVPDIGLILGFVLNSVRLFFTWSLWLFWVVFLFGWGYYALKGANWVLETIAVEVLFVDRYTLCKRIH
ncbi:hypothetical protein L596_022916 [Steinernema carpocapsae]|uniref:Uncharacterized protein n=1 Tax=Steinernema carpocapsae TaxID=34508 RepID=A0A4U5MBZ1_STECR|nr:hypothetical protein L596_022916 [Steinernema carpocapsae]